MGLKTEYGWVCLFKLTALRKRRRREPLAAKVEFPLPLYGESPYSLHWRLLNCLNRFTESLRYFKPKNSSETNLQIIRFRGLLRKVLTLLTPESNSNWLLPAKMELQARVWLELIIPKPDILVAPIHTNPRLRPSSSYSEVHNHDFAPIYFFEFVLIAILSICSIHFYFLLKSSKLLLILCRQLSPFSFLSK